MMPFASPCVLDATPERITGIPLGQRPISPRFAIGLLFHFAFIITASPCLLPRMPMMLAIFLLAAQLHLMAQSAD